jgi:hypothetical protein
VNSRGRAYYNGGVPPFSNPRRITRTETIGFVVIVLIILCVVLARWGGRIPWSAR